MVALFITDTWFDANKMSNIKLCDNSSAIKKSDASWST